MKRYNVDSGIPTLKLALSEFMNSDDLKKLAALTKEKLPTRKADLAAVIMRHLDGERLRTVWQLQRAAVAEVVLSEAFSLWRGNIVPLCQLARAKTQVEFPIFH